MTTHPGFEHVLHAVADIWQRYKNRGVDRSVSLHDDMTHPDWDVENRHYPAAGEEALTIILQALLVCGKSSVDRILDMPCGFGRVVRHLRAAFPHARIYSCDLYDDRISFCAHHFGTTPIKSRERFQDILFPEQFDLIWCGSLLTHLPAPLFSEALHLFSRSLAEGGIAIITLLGRATPFVQSHWFKYLPDDKFQRVEAELVRTGFGYADYDMPQTFFEQKAYGIAVARPSYTLRSLEENLDIHICGYMERHWDRQQDVLILKKARIDEM